MSKTNIKAHEVWSPVLFWLGLVLLAILEVTNTWFAIATAADPFDATARAATNVVVALTAYGGFAMAAWLLSHEGKTRKAKNLRLQGYVAGFVATVALLWTVWQAAGYTGMNKLRADADAFRETPAYAQAVANYKNASETLMLDLNNMRRLDVEAERDKAAAEMEKGAVPASLTIDQQITGLPRAALIYFLTIAMAGAFRLPEKKVEPVVVAEGENVLVLRQKV